eukprot:Awhi_evm1s11315
MGFQEKYMMKQIRRGDKSIESQRKATQMGGKMGEKVNLGDEIDGDVEDAVGLSPQQIAMIGGLVMGVTVDKIKRKNEYNKPLYMRYTRSANLPFVKIDRKGYNGGTKIEYHRSIMADINSKYPENDGSDDEGDDTSDEESEKKKKLSKEEKKIKKAKKERKKERKEKKKEFKEENKELVAEAKEMRQLAMIAKK